MKIRISATSPAPAHAHISPVGASHSVFSRQLSSALPSWSYAFLLIGILLAPFNVYRFRGSITVSDPFLMAAGLLLLIDLLGRRTLLWAPPLILIAAVFSIVGFIGSVFWYGLAPRFATVDFITIFYTTLIIPVVIASQRIDTLQQVRVLIYAWLISNVIQAAVVVCQSQGIELPFVQKDLVMTAWREAGLTLHPNVAGFFASLALPICWALALAARLWRTFLAWLCGTALLLFAIDESGSRTAMLSGLLACAGLSMLFLILRNKLSWTRTLLLAAAAVVALSMLGGGAESALDRLFGDNALTVRANVERENLNARFMAYFWNNPAFGNGYNLAGIHNVFIGTLGLSGIFGFLALILRELAFAGRAMLLLRSLRTMHGDFALAAGLPMMYFVCILAYFKNFVVIERVGFIGIGLTVLFYLCRCSAGRHTPQPSAASDRSPSVDAFVRDNPKFRSRSV